MGAGSHRSGVRGAVLGCAGVELIPALLVVGGVIAWLAWEVRALRAMPPREKEPPKEENHEPQSAAKSGARSRVRARAKRNSIA